MKTKGIGTIKAAAIYTFGAFMVQGINFITIPIFAKFLTPEAFGLYSSYENWVAIITVLIGFQTAASITNGYTDYGEREIGSYVKTVTVVGWISFVIIFFLTFVFRKQLGVLFELNFLELTFGIVQSLFSYFLAMLLGYFRVTNDPINYLLFSSVNILLSVFLGLFLVNMNYFNGSFSRILGTMFASTFIGSVALIRIHNSGEQMNYEYIKYALILSFPLIFHSFSGIVLGKTDQMMLLKMKSASEMGIFSYGNKFGHAIYVLYTAINQAFIPWYYAQRKVNRFDNITSLVKVYSCLFGLLCSCILMVLPEVITLVSPKVYHSAMYITPIVIVAFYFNFLYIFPSTHEFYCKKTSYIALGTMLSGVLNIVLNFIFINMFGGIGAAMATCVSTIFLLLFHLFIAIIIVGNYEIPFSHFVKHGICILFMLFIYFSHIEYIQLRLFLFAILFIVFCIVAQINYKKIGVM